MNHLKKDIKYTNRDFTEFKQRLIEYSKTYFPQTYNDFSPSSPGMMFIEQASYVGDVLSFYLDTQFQETFIQYAQQTNNVFELAYMFGYKPKISGVAQTKLDFYQQVPSMNDGTGNYIPDYSYALAIEENTSVSSVNGDNFLIQDKIDFSTSSSQDLTDVSIYQTAGNIPQYFLLKKQVKAISSQINTKNFTFTTPTPFTTININDNNIIKILDIFDSNGNKWYEVDYLGQEMILDSIKNTNMNNPNKIDDVPFLLKFKKIQRRFSTRFISLTNLQIQFGAGSPLDTDEEIIPNPNNVGLGLPSIQNKLSTAYSPTNFLYTGTYGIAPSNTTLTVRYLTGGGVKSNISIGSLVNLNKSNVSFSSNNLDPNLSQYVFDSLSCNNPEPASGGKGGDTLEEIRQNTLSFIAAQHRSVTADDYLIRALSMPSNYGSITKAHIEQPKLTDNKDTNIKTLILYILAQNSFGNLDYANNTLKNNLKNYLTQYRMIGDNIEIKNAYIINIGINFEIVVLPEYNNNEVLLNCISLLKSHFLIDKWQLNQPIMLQNLYTLLDKVSGVQTVKNILIMNKAGNSLGYSQYAYDIEGATQNHVIYPSLDVSIFEIRYPDQDIKGKVVPF